MIMNKITNVNPRTRDGNTPFHAATSGGHLEICLIIRDFSDFHPKEKGLTPFHEAAAKGHLETLQKLIQELIKARHLFIQQLRTFIKKYGGP